LATAEKASDWLVDAHDLGCDEEADARSDCEAHLARIAEANSMERAPRDEVRPTSERGAIDQAEPG
jgi:hypothetical protein